MPRRTKTGTREWATSNVNIMVGCPHGCRYCYAWANARRFRRIAAAADWLRPVLNATEIDRRRGRCVGRVMFPTSHDIPPAYLEPCLTVLEKLLAARNEVLITSKPHPESVRRMCEHLEPWRDQILFRFTIGAIDDGILGYWEPGAPTYLERRQALRLAHRAGYATSVSAEPLLQADRVEELLADLQPYITDTFWVGTMRDARQRATAGTSDEALNLIEAGQTHDAICRVHATLRDHPLVRWKDSYRAVLGLSGG